ncbi:MAG: hypothetical protein ABI134_23790 [Byssovorax sp.]
MMTGDQKSRVAALKAQIAATAGAGTPLKIRAAAVALKQDARRAPNSGDAGARAPPVVGRLRRPSPTRRDRRRGAVPGAVEDSAICPPPSNDVTATATDKEGPRELARLGRMILARMRARSPSEHARLPVSYVPPEERKRLRAQLADALAALADEEAAEAAPILISLSAGWMERVLHTTAELEARGPMSKERPRRPTSETP